RVVNIWEPTTRITTNRTPAGMAASRLAGSAVIVVVTRATTTMIGGEKRAAAARPVTRRGREMGKVVSWSGSRFSSMGKMTTGSATQAMKTTSAAQAR